MSILTEEELISLSRRDLQRECKMLQLPATGTTGKLRARLKLYKRRQAKNKATRVVTTEDLLCPITLELPCDPVLAQDGRVYERSAMERHVQTRNAKGLPLTSPITNMVMGDKLLPAPEHTRTIEALIANGAIPATLADEWNQRTKVKQLEQQLFFQHAEQGSVPAMEAIGIGCLQGTGGFPKDFALSHHWSKQAHHFGSVFGTALLGHHLCTGLGTTKAVEQGIMYTSAAAVLGSDLGEYCLGMALADGKYGLAPNADEAMFWLEKCLLDHATKHKKMGPRMKLRAETKLAELKMNPGV